ncbi:hypothetical protein CB1_000589009 [Camelus ferus]|nr:hypothetical protein CB1_000589009 [Camelus ferus]
MTPSMGSVSLSVAAHPSSSVSVDEAAGCLLLAELRMEPGDGQVDPENKSGIWIPSFGEERAVARAQASLLDGAVKWEQDQGSAGGLRREKAGGGSQEKDQDGAVGLGTRQQEG